MQNNDRSAGWGRLQGVDPKLQGSPLRPADDGPHLATPLQGAAPQPLPWGASSSQPGGGGAPLALERFWLDHPQRRAADYLSPPLQIARDTLERQMADAVRNLLTLRFVRQYCIQQATSNERHRILRRSA